MKGEHTGLDALPGLARFDICSLSADSHFPALLAQYTECQQQLSYCDSVKNKSKSEFS